jgi:CPA1 family monovalent cation:H+ antiporter
MALFEWTLALLFGSVLLTGLSRYWSVPYPSLLALAGTAVAFLPFAPQIEIEPELALALFVAPVLLDGAFDTSPRDLKSNVLAVTLLAVAAVLVTTTAVALVGWKFAGIPLAAAITLGAIVAPPDAAAAMAVLGQLHPPRRILAILQGESLLNDATALVVYRIGVVAATGAIVFTKALPLAAVSLIASIVAGYALARFYLFATSRVRDAASGTVLQFVGTFGVWILADRIGLSAIVTIVVYAMTLARIAPHRSRARNRVTSYSVWETAVFVLNVMAFVLMGLQARPILERLSDANRMDAVALAAATLAIVVIVRLVWVVGGGFVLRLASYQKRTKGLPFSHDVLIGWCGMRGLVTLATAFALPMNFPSRDLIVLSAFFVVLGTLVLQGLTLKPLIRWLGIEPDTSVEAEVSRARVAIMQAGLKSLGRNRSPAALALRTQYAAARTVAADKKNPQRATKYDELRMAAIQRQRNALKRLRDSGAIGDEAYHRLEEELDWAELDAAPAGHFQPLTT